MFTERTFATSTAATQKIRTLGGIDFDLLAESELVRHVISESRAGHGGWVTTPNVDICAKRGTTPRR